MNVYFTSYRCNCTVLAKTAEEIANTCPKHGAAIIFGMSGAHQLVEVDAWQPLGLFEKEEVQA